MLDEVCEEGEDLWLDGHADAVTHQLVTVDVQREAVESVLHVRSLSPRALPSAV
jgi:hypothetical protein